MATLTTASVSRSEYDDGNNDGITLTLKKDVYMFLLLLLEKSDFSGSSLLSKLPKHSQQKIILMALFSLVLQLIGLVYVMLMPTRSEGSTMYIYDCKTVSESFTVNKYYDSQRGYNKQVDHSSYNNSIILDNQKCDSFEDTAVFTQDVSPSIFIGKVIAAIMVVAYVMEDYFAALRLSVIIPNSKSKRLQAAWWGYGLLNALAIATLGAKILAIINDSDEALDVLTVGISFILLMEIDNKVYDIVASYCDIIEKRELNGETLFQLKYNNQQLKDTMYENVTWIEKFDMVIICCCVISITYVMFIYNYFYGRIFDRFGITSFSVVGVGICFIGFPLAVVIWYTLKKIYRMRHESQSETY